MPYLIDGHNLIPKIGLHLDNPDDEMELVQLLQDFARIKRQQVEVYFDGAPTGHAGTRKLGTIKAHFVPRGQTADSALRSRLEMMAKSAQNWTVVSSDHEVQRAARTHHASFVPSEDFVRQLRTALSSGTKASGEPQKLSKREVDEWLKLFGEDD